MPRLLLVRHARSTWNLDGRWQGRADPPLSEAGLADATDAGAQLPPGLAAAHASDQQRAAQTARALAPDLGLTLHPGLRERDLGPWQGRTKAEIERAWPGWIAERRWPEAAEDDDALRERVLPALDAVADLAGDTAVLVVAHSAVIRVLERHLGLTAPVLPNLAGRWLDRDASGAWTIAHDRVLLSPERAVADPTSL